MGQLHVPDHTGDTRTIWKPEGQDEVDAAKETFKRLEKEGYLCLLGRRERCQGGDHARVRPARRLDHHEPAVRGWLSVPEGFRRS